jgi:hypothetical protein
MDLGLVEDARFFRTICGWRSTVSSLEDELSTAAVGRFVASADLPPPWTTLRGRLRYAGVGLRVS